MKTRNFTLYAAILMMATVVTATGQPDRGERRGNHENSDRRELKSAVRTETSENQNRRSDVARDARITRENRIHSIDRPDVLKESSSREGRLETIDQGDRRSYSTSGAAAKQHNAVPEKQEKIGKSENRTGEKNYYNNNNHINRQKPDKQEGYSDNRNYRDIPSGNHRNVWSDRNYSRLEWERRHYNWNEHHWNFSNYYKKGYVPYYFRDNRNYWFFPGYGHILRGFRNEPVIIYSGYIPYYYQDGFFYRYYNGIGYVWVEEPWGIWFNELPYGAVKVRINGKVYFRLGNSYFRFGVHGFRLVLLPDRYYDPRFDRGVHFEVSARF